MNTKESRKKNIIILTGGIALVLLSCTTFGSSAPKITDEDKRATDIAQSVAATNASINGTQQTLFLEQTAAALDQTSTAIASLVADQRVEIATTPPTETPSATPTRISRGICCTPTHTWTPPPPTWTYTPTPTPTWTDTPIVYVMKYFPQNNFACGSAGQIMLNIEPINNGAELQVNVTKCDSTAFKQDGFWHIRVDGTRQFGGFNHQHGLYVSTAYLGESNLRGQFEGYHDWDVELYSNEAPTKALYTGVITIEGRLEALP